MLRQRIEKWFRLLFPESGILMQGLESAAREVAIRENEMPAPACPSNWQYRNQVLPLLDAIVIALFIGWNV
jgi:hypothetical protein